LLGLAGFAGNGLGLDRFGSRRTKPVRGIYIYMLWTVFSLILDISFSLFTYSSLLSLCSLSSCSLLLRREE